MPSVELRRRLNCSTMPSVTLGIFAKTFVRPGIDEVFDAVAQLGVSCVQFNLSSAGLPTLPDAVEPVLLERIRRAASERRIAIAAVSGTFNMIHPDALQRRHGLRRLEILAGACAGLGAPVVTLCTGTRDPDDMWRAHPQNDSAEAWRDLLASLAEALAFAETHGICLGIEPETGNVIRSARHARRLLDELKSSRLKVVMDAANLFAPGDVSRMPEVLEEAFDLLGADVLLAHAKELGGDASPANLAPGEGLLDWDRYLGLLQKAGFEGPLILHGCGEADAARGIEFLGRKLEERPQRCLVSPAPVSE